jgi:hypothetical protein
MEEPATITRSPILWPISMASQVSLIQSSTRTRVISSVVTP